MNPQTLNWPIVLSLIALAAALVYYILPKLMRDYTIEKGVKLVLIYGVLGYMAYEFLKKGNYIFVGIFILGAVMYTYLILIAKRK